MMAKTSCCPDIPKFNFHPSLWSKWPLDLEGSRRHPEPGGCDERGFCRLSMLWTPWETGTSTNERWGKYLNQAPILGWVQAGLSFLIICGYRSRWADPLPPRDCKAWRDQGTDRFSKAIRQEAENLLATSPYNPTGAEPTMPLRVVQQLVPDERKRNHTLEHSRCSERERTSRTRAAVPDVSTWELVDNVKSNLNNNT